RASTAVPGVVAGLCRMAERQGRLPLATLIEPACRYAREGFEVSRMMADILRLLTPIFGDTPGCHAMFAPAGRFFDAGERMAFPALARTFERLRHEGPDLFYRG